MFGLTPRLFDFLPTKAEAKSRFLTSDGYKRLAEVDLLKSR